MYYISEKNEAVKIIQKYLGISESGNYDEKTKEEVIKQQKFYGLNPSGIVDIKTYEALREGYYRNHSSELNAAPDALYKFPYKRNDYGEDIAIINSYLAKALDNFNYYEKIPRGNYFDIYTERAILKLREIFSLKGDNTLDKDLYWRIKREILTPIK